VTPVPDICQFLRFQHLAHPGDTLGAIYWLEDGWACRYKLFSAGRRQITALYLPGEFCELHWLLDARAADPVVALTSLRARTVSFDEFADLSSASGNDTRKLLSATLAVLNQQSDWIAALGRKTAVERLCALLCDLFERLQCSGRVINDCCTMPLTQVDLADILGLTAVHVNRVLKLLRSRGWIELQGKELRVIDLGMLSKTGSGTLPM